MSAEYSEPIECYLELIHKTAEAYLFTDGIDKFWIAKSQVMELEHIKANDFMVILPQWVARAKEII